MSELHLVGMCGHSNETPVVCKACHDTERDRLKAELESCDKYAKEQYKAYDQTIMELKSRAEKLAEAGNVLARRVDPNMFQKQLNEWKEALSDFEKAKP